MPIGRYKSMSFHPQKREWENKLWFLALVRLFVLKKLNSELKFAKLGLKTEIVSDLASSEEILQIK